MCAVLIIIIIIIIIIITDRQAVVSVLARPQATQLKNHVSVPDRATRVFFSAKRSHWRQCTPSFQFSVLRRSSLGVKRLWREVHHLNLVSRLRMSGTILSFSRMPSWEAHEQFYFTFIIIIIIIIIIMLIPSPIRHPRLVFNCT